MTGGQKMKVYKVFNNIITEIEVEEDFGTSDFMGKYYVKYASGNFNKPWCEFTIYEISLVKDSRYPSYVLDTGFSTVDCYLFDEFMSLVQFLKGIDLTIYG